MTPRDRAERCEAHAAAELRLEAAARAYVRDLEDARAMRAKAELAPESCDLAALAIAARERTAAAADELARRLDDERRARVRASPAFVRVLERLEELSPATAPDRRSPGWRR